ncbi:precorrin-8X methylmutase [Tsukamurella sp. M9C]|uniref:precorrin-8X methylmutase n=1 Tax=unclassified Tsukamurella TaxID=2633480 RepID=UPI001CCF4D38|nr:precorrin-8X methylmutase [Tsukamurella sp. M9C]MCA0156734.1 precorrin-8X methylmutase [Tsukamurella sp. M9C]
MHDYLTDGAEIYRRSFATIRAEADLAALAADAETVAVRMIHAAGQVDLDRDIRISAGAVAAGRSALRAGAPILADANMVVHGVTRARLPEDNEVLCQLRDPRVPALAAEIGNTRSAAALQLWGERMAGAVVAIGNAPTALFHLLDLLAAGAPKPAVVVGIPVGFIGAAESKDALVAEAAGLGVEYITVLGRRGGSAITAAALNALAREEEL